MIYELECDMFKSHANCFLHQVNCQGKMGSGVAKQVKEQFPDVYRQYKALCVKYKPEQLLGHLQLISTAIPGGFGWVANAFAQLNYGYGNTIYTDYEALEKCFQEADDIIPANCIIAMPYKIGCCRGGGNWEIVYNLIKKSFIKHDVYICKYKGDD